MSALNLFTSIILPKSCPFADVTGLMRGPFVYLCLYPSRQQELPLFVLKSEEGGVHFKNSLDLIESQRTGRTTRSLADVPAITNDITLTVRCTFSPYPPLGHTFPCLHVAC